MNTVTGKINEAWHRDVANFENAAAEPLQPKWFDSGISDFLKIQTMRTDIVQTEVYCDFMGNFQANYPAAVARKMLYQLSRCKVCKARGTKRWLLRVEAEFIYQWENWKNEFQTNILKGVEPKV